MEVLDIKLSDIQQNENSRVTYKNVDVADLMRSIKRYGLLHPVGIRKLKGGKYEAVFGNTRIVACKKLGWDEIPAQIVDADTDIERDLLGLVENFKRTQTSVAEDGRIFQSLMDRGLSEGEIAARLDVPLMRVEAALDVMRVVPEAVRGKVVYGRVGQKTMKGKVPATTAMRIISAAKSARLKREQVTEMFEYAARSRPSPEVIAKVAPIMKNGASFGFAIQAVAALEKVSLTVYVKESHARKLEKQTGKQLHQLIYARLKEAKDLKLITPSDRRLKNTRLRARVDAAKLKMEASG